jgi:hypothetical protein
MPPLQAARAAMVSRAGTKKAQEICMMGFLKKVESRWRFSTPPGYYPRGLDLDLRAHAALLLVTLLPQARRISHGHKGKNKPAIRVNTKSRHTG